MAARKRGGVSWELVGILAVLTVFLVGALIWLGSPEGQDELVAPKYLTLDPDLDLESGTTDDGYPYLGSPDASVEVFEFSDFQCSHCRDFAETAAPLLAEDYLATGKARLVFVSLTISGDESVEAAKAGICAGEQGRFWDMHDWLFANQSIVANRGSFSRDRVIEMATSIGLDAELFESCVADGATAARVRDGEDLARTNGIGGTPSFLIGERLVTGADLAGLTAAIDEALGE